jgi:glyoxylase-like metal-dependent hydrolase (beta-lactamase superfamily II)
MKIKLILTALLLAGSVTLPAQKKIVPVIAANNANVQIVTKGAIKVHSYVNPQLVAVSSHIIELKDSLVIIDAQLTYTFTKEVAAYAASLNKPVARVILTHAHPDHILGLYAFKDYPVYALSETINTIKTNGENFRQVFLKNFGEKDAAPAIVIPTNELPEGSFTIDGENFMVKKYADNEMDFCATIEMPAEKLLFAGDLLYNRLHLFPGFNHLASWKTLLEKAKKSMRNRIIFPGHGYAGTALIVKENIAYLKYAIEVAAKPGMNATAYKTTMKERYPDYGAAILMDFGADALFEKNK